jgi:phosphoglycolate phosphatase-like HAD superfamily hydrolase
VDTGKGGMLCMAKASRQSWTSVATDHLTRARENNMARPKQQVSVVITDLDNTLFDWFGVWHASFNAMLNKIFDISGVSSEDDKRQIIREIKTIHEKHGTSEYSFLIEEIPTLQKLHPSLGPEQIKEHYDDAIHVYNKERSIRV